MSAGLLIFLAFLATSVIFLGLERYLYVTHRPLITHKVREWNRDTHGLVALVFGLVAGLLGGHFFWCS